MMINKFCLFFLNAFLLFEIAACQTNELGKYVLTNELVVKKNSGITKVRKATVGTVHGKIVLPGNSQGIADSFLLFDESTQQLTPHLTLSNNPEKVFDVMVKDNRIAKKGFFSVPEKYIKYSIDNIPIDSMSFQDIWIEDGTTVAKIDTYPFHYIDKFYEVNFSSDGSYLIVNPYTNVSAGYWAANDNRFYTYSLGGLQRNYIEKRTISCERCMNVNIINDDIIYVKEIELGGGRDGYHKNIYIAPIKDIDDTVKIAHDISLIKMSPDGKFFLGEKYLHGEPTCVIVDVDSKRFQYLLGRKYPVNYSYYSPDQKKFAFDFGTHIVYINFPETYPFDALSKKTNQSSKTEDSVFWRRYQHEGLK